MDDRELVAKTLLLAEDPGGDPLYADRIWAHTEHSGDCKQQPWTCSVCLKEEHLAKADAVLAALAKAGRLAPEVKGDVLLKAYDEAVEVYAGISGEIESDALHAAVVAASGIVAADAERRVRAEILRQLTDVQDDPHFSSEYGNGFDHAVSIVKDSNKCSTP